YAFESHFFAQKCNEFPVTTLKLLFKYVIRATYNKRDFEAHEELLKSGMLLGLANVNHLKIPLIHCFAMPIVRQTKCSYAVAIAMMLPYAMLMYRDVNEWRGKIITNKLAIYDEHMKDIYCYLKFCLANLFKTLGYPLTLKALGVSTNDIPTLGHKAFTMWLNNNRDNPNWNEMHFTSIFAKAFAGKIDNPFN